MDAKKYWLFNTDKCPELPTRINAPHAKENLRRKGSAIAWVEWDIQLKTADLRKLEKLPNTPKGEGAKLLHFILSACDKFNISLHGNINAYDPCRDTECTPDANAKLARWYEKNGVSAIQDERGLWHINYPPASITS